MADLARFEVLLEDCPSMCTFESGSSYSFVSVNVLDNLVPTWKTFPSSTFRLSSSITNSNPCLDIIDTKDFKVKIGSIEKYIPLSVLGHGNDMLLDFNDLGKFISTLCFNPPNYSQEILNKIPSIPLNIISQ